MSKTIIFISGWAVPKFIAKSKWVWDKDFWADYKCIWLSSKTPTSDGMVQKELNKLQNLLNLYPDATLAGQSLGGWWASNLALRSEVKIKKLVLWTPLGNAGDYLIFNVTPRFHPPHQELVSNSGPNRVLVLYGKDDLIVPPDAHAHHLSRHFRAMDYKLNGGHLYQSNHRAALQYMKDWIET